MFSSGKKIPVCLASVLFSHLSHHKDRMRVLMKLFIVVLGRYVCGAGPIGINVLPNFANSYALSFPSIPIRALIHFTVIFVFSAHLISTALRSFTVLFVVVLF